MASVRFAWNPVLVELRRQVCPNARWQKSSRQWLMRDDEVRSFLQAAQTVLEYRRSQTEIRVDDVTWVMGFVQGAPYRLTEVAAA